MNTQPTLEGYNLLHEGTLALMDVEHNGMRVDTDYCRIQKKKLRKRIKKLEGKILSYPEGRVWKDTYDKYELNIDSDDQIADVLFDKMNYKSIIKTKTGKNSVSEEALEQIKTPFVEDIVLRKKLSKAENTYLENYIKESVDGTLHPFFHLHTVKSMRSSSSNINFQNQPTRHPEMKKLIRRAVKSRNRDYLLAEIDYRGAEICGAACYHKDPGMVDEITNPLRDMHRDMAQEIFKLSDTEWTGDSRFSTKNNFIFAQFYGDWYKTCAKNLWDSINILNLKTFQNVGMKKHLKKHGIGSYRKFEKHIQQVEDYFWNEKFKVYGKWKDTFWNKYLKTGYVDSLTGFRFIGPMKRNEAINYPIQGAAFHFLLWSLIQLNKWLKRRKMKTKIIGQIHDSIVLDLHKDEINIVLRQCKYIMEKKIRKHWPWIIVPLKADVELCPVNASWYLKKEAICLEDDPCDCGSKWFRKFKLEKNSYLDCPICGNEYEL